MTGIRDIESGKIYIGVEEPAKLDQAVETLNGDKPYDGTLVATGPSFLGAHKGGFAKATLNVGTALGDWSPGVSGRAVQVEGDVEIIGERAANAVFVDGNSHVTGNISTGGDLSVGGFASWSGSIVATTKLFDIEHPSKENHRLRHACLEGSEHAVYHRGRLKGKNIIELPYYWKDLIHEDSITVQLQSIGKHQNLVIESFNNEYVVVEIGANQDFLTGEILIDCFYHVYAERKDVDKLEVEYKGEKRKQGQS